MILLPEPIQFQWDAGNQDKNWMKHQVSNEECEEVFFDPRKRIFKDTFHSGLEERYLLLGRTKPGRLLFVAFTMRKKKIRVISARDLNQRERKLL